MILVYLINQYRHCLSAYICINPFKLPYGCYNFRSELSNKPFVIKWFPSTFGFILGHH